MNKEQIENPFVVSGYVSPKYFCDREEETRNLIKQVQNGRNTVLVSPRRMGKSGLIRHCFQQPSVKNSYYTFYIDIYATSSLAEFVYLLSKEVYSVLKPQKTKWKEQFFQVIRSLRVGFKLDTVTGEPGFDIGIGDVQTPQVTLDEIFKYLESADKPCIVAIDEFQQIGEYPKKNIEALLRTHIQKCKQTRFIFSGSKRHIMSNMFFSASKPFYESASGMPLNPIPLKNYSRFAVRLFEERNKKIEKPLIEEIYHRFGGCTWFVQMMMNELYSLTRQGEICTDDLFDVALNNIITSRESIYKDMLAFLAPKQRIVLQAVAKEREVKNITSAAFIKKYNLLSASSVQAALKALVKNDWVLAENNTYRVYDYFFAEWLRTY